MMCSLKYAASTKLGCPGKLQVNLKLREERIIVVYKERPASFLPGHYRENRPGMYFGRRRSNRTSRGYLFETHQKKDRAGLVADSESRLWISLSKFLLLSLFRSAIIRVGLDYLPCHLYEMRREIWRRTVLRPIRCRWRFTFNRPSFAEFW